MSKETLSGEMQTKLCDIYFFLIVFYMVYATPFSPARLIT